MTGCNKQSDLVIAFVVSIDLSKAQNSADDEDNLIDSNVDQEEKGPEMEEEAVQQLTEGQEQLQHMIAQTLSDHMKKLKVL